MVVSLEWANKFSELSLPARRLRPQSTSTTPHDHAISITLVQNIRQASKLAGFKVPKELIVRAELPRNASGKILKRVLRETLAEQSTS